MVVFRNTSGRYDFARRTVKGDANDRAVAHSMSNPLESRSTMKLLFPFLISLLPAASWAQSQSPASQPPSGVPSPRTTEVMVIVTAKQGVDRQQIMKVMPAEVRATVKLYLDGQIRQWYSKGDGRGVILVLDVKTVDEAHAIMDTLPLAKANLVDHEYIPVGPLLPLAGLIGDGPARQ
jgi:hypothetical protein